MSNLMIIGANTLQVPLIIEAKKMCFNTIVVSPNKAEPGFKYADISIYKDVKDKEKILEYAIKYNICGIVTDQTDNSVRTVAYISEIMGLPGIGFDKSILFTDKFMMREKCKELGIKTLKYLKTNKLREAIEFYERLKSDCILKPIDNQGSQGVYHITSKAELIELFNKTLFLSSGKEALIEEYIDGEEYVIDGLVVNNKYQYLAIGKPTYFRLPDVFSASSIIFPPSIDSPLLQKVKNLDSKIINSFGLRNGRTHSEFIVDDDEDVYLIETAARGGGVFISSDIIPILTGINNEKVLIDIATNQQEMFPELKITNNVCGYIAFYLPEGEVTFINGIDSVKGMKFVHNHNLESLYIGLKTLPYTDKRGRFFLVISAETHKKLQENFKLIKKTLKIRVNTDQGIKEPIWG